MERRTYRYFTGQPLYRFGDGLSYTSFAYSRLRVPSTAHTGEDVTVEADLRNNGSLAGDEVAELYLTQPRGYQTPVRKLVAFQRVHLTPGQSTHISLKIDSRSLSQVDEKGNHMILPGDYTISLGSTQPGAGANTVAGHFTVTGRRELSK
jgi:beta-glucosidase